MHSSGPADMVAWWRPEKAAGVAWLGLFLPGLACYLHFLLQHLNQYHEVEGGTISVKIPQKLDQIIPHGATVSFGNARQPPPPCVRGGGIVLYAATEKIWLMLDCVRCEPSSSTRNITHTGHSAGRSHHRRRRQKHHRSRINDTASCDGSPTDSARSTSSLCSEPESAIYEYIYI